MSQEILKNKTNFSNILSITDNSHWLEFMTTFIRSKNVITGIFWIYILLILSYFVFAMSAKSLLAIEARSWIVGLMGGFLFSLLISSIIHELTHSLFFKFYGARSIRFSWSWRMLRFTVQANDFLISRKRYYIICLLTFFLLTVAPLIASLFISGIWFFAFLSLSFFHALYAIKDVAVCSYLYKYEDSYIYSSEENKVGFYKSKP